MSKKHVVIVGAGITGLTVAKELSRFDLEVDVVESSFFIGGNSAQFACKATDRCVQCGACVAETTLDAIRHSENIHFYPLTKIQKISKGKTFELQFIQSPQVLDPFLCNQCGRCLDVCPEKKAVRKSLSPNAFPSYAIDTKKCLAYRGIDCQRCADICEKKAINLRQKVRCINLPSDAIILSTGNRIFDPSDKPYGYGRYEDVITHFELEKMLKSNYGLKKNSDGKSPSSIAFIQCVGSRDSRLGHLWCSKTCCGSSLRMAGLIKHLYKDIRIHIFYIDIQNFGKQFECELDKAREHFNMIRSIPGDIFKTKDDSLKIRYFNPETKSTTHLLSDLVVLSTAMIPGKDNAKLSKMFKVDMNENGFLMNGKQSSKKKIPPIFAAGTLNGPKSIAECVSEAKSVALKTLDYFGMSF